MRHVRNLDAVEYTVGGMRDGFIEAVLGNPDGGRTDIELTDVNGIQGRIPGMRIPGKGYHLW